MVEVGNLNVKFGANTAGFQQGFANVKNSLVQASKNTKSVRADFVRLAGTTSDIAKKAVLAFGAAGLAGGIAGIISKSPALAPAFAQMKVGATELGLSLGNILAPAFDKLVTILPSVNKFVNENSDSLGKLFTGLADATTGVVEFGLEIGGQMLPALSKVASWFGEHPALFASLIFGPAAIKGFAAAGTFLKTLGSLAVANPVVAALTAVAGLAYATNEFVAPYVKEKIQEATGQTKLGTLDPKVTAKAFAHNIFGFDKGFQTPDELLEQAEILEEVRRKSERGELIGNGTGAMYGPAPEQRSWYESLQAWFAEVTADTGFRD